MIAQLELAAAEAQRCAWCGSDQDVSNHHASMCCLACAKAPARARVTAWLRRVGRKAQR